MNKLDKEYLALANSLIDNYYKYIQLVEKTKKELQNLYKMSN